MLKPRYIVIIFLAMLLCISTICMIIEANLVTNAARLATSYTQIAAECALKSATMTDEFFTSGIGDDAYTDGIATMQNGFKVDVTKAGSSGLLIDLGSGNFTRDKKDTNVYNLTFGIGRGLMSNKAFAYQAYSKMYKSDAFAKWSREILSAQYGNSTNNLDFTCCARPVMWSDTIEYSTSRTVQWLQTRGVTYIPKLLTMGTSLFAENGSLDYAIGGTEELYNKLEDLSVKKTTHSLEKGTTNKFFGTYTGNYKSLWVENQGGAVSNADKAQAILEGSDYWDYRRTTTINYDLDDFSNQGSSTDIDYYYTPTSLGLTYIDPDMLDILFRSNLDLLMRAGFMDSNGNLNSGYDSNIRAGYYDSLDTALEGTWGNYAVNNGQFYYFRGKPSVNTNGKLTYKDLSGATCSNTPEIEYYYLPISGGDKNPDNKPTVNTLSQLNKNTALRSVIYRAIDPTATPSSLYSNLNNSQDTKTYELVVAKVTFYADFIYPFKTSTLRGMSHWWGNNSSSSSRIAENESLSMGITEKALTDLGISPSDIQVESVVDGCYQYKYTCYYAIAV